MVYLISFAHVQVYILKKRKKLLPRRMMRMQELGRDYKRFCSSWLVAKARVNLASLTCFKEVSVAGARCAA